MKILADKEVQTDDMKPETETQLNSEFLSLEAARAEVDRAIRRLDAAVQDAPGVVKVLRCIDDGRARGRIATGGEC